MTRRRAPALVPAERPGSPRASPPCFAARASRHRAFCLFIDDATGPGVTAPRLRRFAGLECLNLFNAPGDDADLLAAALAETLLPDGARARG